MSQPPARPKLYHITHVDNIASIVADGLLLSDAAMVARGGPASRIGMSNTKTRRLTLPVDCHPGDRVGDYIPFYFCPRSIMLYVIYCANHQDLTYRGGQAPIVHLESDLHDVVSWANIQNRRWAFSLSNAGARYAEFRSTITDLDQIDWAAVASTDFVRLRLKNASKPSSLYMGHFPGIL